MVVLAGLVRAHRLRIKNSKGENDVAAYKPLDKCANDIDLEIMVIERCRSDNADL